MLTTDQISQARQSGVSDSQIQSYIAQNGGGQTPEPRSFAGEILPTAFGIGGGILGGMAGTAALPGPGTVAGGIAGATAGGALGEGIQQSIEKSYGQRQNFDTPQVAAQGALNGAMEATGMGVAKVAGTALNAARPGIATLLSKFSGYSGDVVQKLLESGAVKGAVQGGKNVVGGVKTGIQQGERGLVDIVKATIAKVHDHANQVLADSKAFISSLDSRLPAHTSGEQVVPYVHDMVSKIAANLSTDYKIGVDPAKGALDFNRPMVPSDIVVESDQKTISKAFAAVKTIANSPSIPHIDAIVEKLIKLQSKTPGGTATGGETKIIIHSMLENIHSGLSAIPQDLGGSVYHDYAQHLTDMLPKRVMINDAKEIFGPTAHPSPKELSTITKRVLQMYNTGNLPTADFVNTMGHTIGSDVMGTLAGATAKIGDQGSMRAPSLTKRGIIEKAIEYIPRSALKNYAATGKLTPEINKVVKGIGHITGLTAKTILRDIISLHTNMSATDAPAPDQAPDAPQPDPAAPQQ